jgi:hypothetical protein
MDRKVFLASVLAALRLVGRISPHRLNRGLCRVGRLARSLGGRVVARNVLLHSSNPLDPKSSVVYQFPNQITADQFRFEVERLLGIYLCASCLKAGRRVA